MSKVIQCDRCKDVYNNPTKGKYTLRMNDKFEFALDLCPKCIEELEKWVDEGRKECHIEN